MYEFIYQSAILCIDIPFSKIFDVEEYRNREIYIIGVTTLQMYARSVNRWNLQTRGLTCWW